MRFESWLSTLPEWFFWILFFVSVFWIALSFAEVCFYPSDEKISRPSIPLTSQKREIWHWAFLCSLAANITLFIISFGKPYVDYDGQPIRAGIAEGTFIAATLFGFFVGPFFFRRFRVLALLCWMVATVSVIREWLPIF